MWSPLLIFAIVIIASTAEWHEEFGPWVIATKGEVWPIPKTRTVKDHFYILRPGFTIHTVRRNCDILKDAAERYSAIILAEARTARQEAEGRRRKLIRNNPLCKGTLQRLEIRMHTPCNENGQHWPSLSMNESYALHIKESSTIAVLEAPTVWGALRGLETFSQILMPSGDGPTLIVKCQTILDEPKLPHRGLLLDTARHYFPLHDILLILDAMSYNKLNVLHWHIVDDNSFPYQSIRYPELSTKGSFHPSMVYTPKDVQKVVNYARLRGIRVIPEFDTPGHTKSWGESHPELLTPCYDPATGKPNGHLGPMNPINPKVYTFLRSLFTEIVSVFPERYIHLGGDEVRFNCWASNPSILRYMEAHNMSHDFATLETAFVFNLLDILNSLDASTIVWQEVFDNGVPLPPTTAVHVWTGFWMFELAKATKAGHPVLLSACWYLDHVAGGGDWQKFYNCDPLGFPGSTEMMDLMLGGEACMWGEFVDKNNVHSRIWPRASATAERLWSWAPVDLENASKRLEEHVCRMNRRGIPAQPPNGPGFCVT